MTTKPRAKCPCCELAFTKSRSNQRYCSTPCQQRASNASLGRTPKATSKEILQRRRKKAKADLSAGRLRSRVKSRDEQSITKPRNDPKFSNVFSDLEEGFGRSSIPDLGSIEQHHRVFIESAPLTKIDRPELWGLSETPTEGGLFRVIDVSKVPWHVLWKQQEGGQ